jgi:hypothetical protein
MTNSAMPIRRRTSLTMDWSGRPTSTRRQRTWQPGQSGAVIPDDVPDPIDTMNQMLTSGRIDNDAFAGEPMDDDEEDILGETDDDDDDNDDN